MTRDAVRMLVATKSDGSLVHTHFSELPRFLDEGDLVVVNTSGTLAAEIDGTSRRRAPCRSTCRPACRPGCGRSRSAAAARPTSTRGARRRDRARRRRPRRASSPPTPRARAGDGVRLWVSRSRRPSALHTYLARYGRPIRYGYVQGSYPLSAYQNVYVTEPGSAEMPSAGRPFTPEVLTRLVAKGVGVAPLLLHTGVASLEANEPPYAEYFRVSLGDGAPDQRHPPPRRAGRRHRHDGGPRPRDGGRRARARAPGEGWTETVVSPERPVRSIDGFLTGWHEPEASHLAMLEAIAGPAAPRGLLRRRAREGYLWHEFGDVHLILP